MFIARGLESQVVVHPPVPGVSPSKSAPASGGAPKVAHLNEEQAISLQSFGALAIRKVFHPLSQGQSLFPVRVTCRDYSHADRDPTPFDKLLEVLKRKHIAGMLF